MSPHPMVERLSELDQAIQDLITSLDRLHGAVAEVRRMRREGAAASRIVEIGPGVSARREVRRAWSGLNSALHDYRVGLVRSMIDREGMSIADVARATGNARQVISRLYHSDPHQAEAS